MKGQIISGDFNRILIRKKSDKDLELGEILVAENNKTKILLQVFDLVYGSQISQQNLELISGLKLEDNNDLELFDPNLRNYTLAYIKPMISIDADNARLCKALPSFFTEVREITKEDLTFLTTPENPLFIGQLRSGSQTLDFDIFLPGKEVFSHHILIPATTGRGKSLDENEEVLIKTNNNFSIKSIGEIVNNSSNFKGSKVLSMNPKNYSMDFKKIIKFVKHKAPSFMYEITTESGREITVTGDHNLYVLNDGKLKLLKTKKITKQDYLPLPLKINITEELKELNLFELLKNSKNIFVMHNGKIIDKFKPKKECLRILSQYYKKPGQKYSELINSNRIRIELLDKLLIKPLSIKELKSLYITDLHETVKLKAIYPISKEFLELIGMYIAEGYCLNDNTFRISCSEKEMQKILENNLKKIGLNYFWVKRKNKNIDLGVSSSLFTKLIKKIGIGSLSGDKRLPYFFMNLSNKNLRALLRVYYDGDGGIDITKNETSKRFKISSTTKSKKLASDLCLAMYRYSILARSKKRWLRATNTNHKGNWYYRVAISGKTDLINFLSKVGFNLEKKNNILKDKLDYKENTNVDVIPINLKEFKLKREETKLSQKQFSLKINYDQQMISFIESGKRRPSRQLFTRILKKFKNFKDLEYLTNFKWDKIKEIKKIKYNKKYVYDLTIKDNKTFLAGHGGIFVHNSNLTSIMLWNLLDQDYAGILVLDPHDEYYGRNKLALKDHPKANEKIVYYTSKNPPPGCKTLKVNIRLIKPQHFHGVVDLSDPQKQLMNLYHKEFTDEWIQKIIMEIPLQTATFKDDTLAVVKRNLLYLLDLEITNNQIQCKGICDHTSGMTTINDIVREIEQAKIVIIDTSNFSGTVELLVGSLITTEIFKRYKSYKIKGELEQKPVVSIVLEEAPRVLGKDILEKGSNIFSTIAREGRKFKVGLTAITQLPSLIPRDILANMNTKIILGVEMKPERQAIIESASQDLSDDDRNIASLDKGEAIITSNFTKFATPIKIPLFDEIVKNSKAQKTFKKSFDGISLN